MKLDKFTVSPNLEDRRKEPTLDELMEAATSNLKEDRVTPDKSLTEGPSGDIGSEMQNLRGYGKARSSKMWRVR